MFAEALLAVAFQVGPFYEQKSDYAAFRPFWSEEGTVTDVLWPVWTQHSDWWRFCFFLHYQSYSGDGYQFEVLPLWWNGKQETGDYWGLFPIWGTHPHFLIMYDWKFCLWPVWMQYKMPRPSEEKWMETTAVLWPFFHWRDDGSWGIWPLYVCNHQRESFHQSVLWPIFTWATYDKDRDTAGEGSSWMLWPLWADVERERERQWMFLPPLFSYAEVSKKAPGGRRMLSPLTRLRCPWPFVEIEHSDRRDRISIFPIWESVSWKGYSNGERSGSVQRFGWKLVELYDDETRVFPFWTSRKDGSFFRLWPFYESERGEDGTTHGRFLSLFPIRWVPAVDRNWAKFWTFYERDESQSEVSHSLFWGIIRWKTSSEDDTAQ